MSWISVAKNEMRLKTKAFFPTRIENTVSMISASSFLHFNIMEACNLTKINTPP